MVWTTGHERHWEENWRRKPGRVQCAWPYVCSNHPQPSRRRSRSREQTMGTLRLRMAPQLWWEARSKGLRGQPGRARQQEAFWLTWVRFTSRTSVSGCSLKSKFGKMLSQKCMPLPERIVNQRFGKLSWVLPLLPLGSPALCDPSRPLQLFMSLLLHTYL